MPAAIEMAAGEPDFPGAGRHSRPERSLIRAMGAGQPGHLAVCGDAGPDLGDSLYEAVLYVRGKVASLGSDCIEKPMTEAHRARLSDLLGRAGFVFDAPEFGRYGSPRNLYNFHIDHACSY
jgi:hypothetical protein